MKFRVYIAASVDGYVADVDGSVAWLEPFQAEHYGYDQFVTSIAAIVMGRTTFDQVLGFGPWPYAGKQVFVLTSTPLENPPPDTTPWHKSPAELVHHLRDSNLGGDTWLMGGPRTIHAFRVLDVVDSYELYVLPVLLGQGIPLFERRKDSARLRLADHHVFSDGAIELVYEPIRAGG